MDDDREKKDGRKLKKIEADFANDIKHPDAENFIVKNNLNLERLRFWYREPHRVLAEHGSDFDKFTENCRGLVRSGEGIMMNVQSTGFNIDRFDIFTTSDFDPDGDRPTIFYNCYIEKPMHFAMLLADMERLGLIDMEDLVSFSCKGTKVNWKWGESDSEGEVKKMKRSDGTIVAVKATMETVLKLTVGGWEKFPLILDYLDAHVFLRGKVADEEICIPWSFQDPDIRVLPDFIDDDILMAQPVLGEELEERYKPATMNELSDQRGNKLLVLRQGSSFGNKSNTSGWVSKKIVVNRELFDYLKSDDVGP